MLDGADLGEYDPEALRKNIGIIFQDFVKFQMTAAHKSLANHVIDHLPKGYDQVVGHRFQDGVDISGG